MSSQATLVNPTQPRSTAPQRREPPPREAQKIDPRPQKRRRNNAQPYVLIDPQRGRAHQQRSDHQVQVQPVEDEIDELDEPEDVESQPVGQTNEDDEVVEEMLDGSIEHSGRLSPEVPYDLKEPDMPFELPIELPWEPEELDSDDERARQNLSLQRGPPQPSASGAHAGPSRVTPATVPGQPFVDEDDVFAEGLDLTISNASRRASGSAAPIPSSSRASAQRPVTPSASRNLLRIPSVAESTSTSSSDRAQDPVNHVPLDGTRASAERRRARESAKHEPYSPPPGSKAYEMVVQVSAKRTSQTAHMSTVMTRCQM